MIGYQDEIGPALREYVRDVMNQQSPAFGPDELVERVLGGFLLEYDLRGLAYRAAAEELAEDGRMVEAIAAQRAHERT